MTVWCHLPTIFNRRHALRIAGLIMLCVALITTLFLTSTTRAEAGINQTISFQGRLLNAAGGIVPDGHYNIQFKLYQDGDGTVTGNTHGSPTGSLKWSETYTNNNSNSGVPVKNGYFSVNLGSKTAFGTSVDWNQDTLWLSMNIAGSAATCTQFGTGPCSGDGEMLPMKRLNATPFSLNSQMLGGKTANSFIQLGQGVQTDATNNTPSIFLNKTGSGNLLQLQNNASDVFTVTNSGDMMFGGSSNHSIFINDAAANTAGNQLAISGGAGGSGTGSTGGTLSLQGGAAGGTNGNGGNVQIDAGAKTGSGSDGYISIGATNAGTINIGSNSVALTQNINIGTNDTPGSTSNVTIGSGSSAAGGTTTIQGKDGVTINGTTTVTTQTDSTKGFTVSSSQGNDTLTVDTANGRVAVGGLLGNSAPSLDGYGLQVQGALRLTGGNDYNMTDLYTTPMGSNVHTKINIPLYDPGQYGQIIALGLPNTADPTARVLSLFDARTTAHQPTIGVFSPDEGNLVGFSWDGSNSIAAVKNTGNKIALQGGNNRILVAANNGGAANVGIGNDATSGYALDVTGDTNTSGGYRIGGNTALTNSSLTFTGGSPANISTGAGQALNLNGTGGLTIQTNGSARATFSDSKIQIGDGDGNGSPTLLTVDKSASAPTVSGDAALGSIYYDTTKGMLQCYEAGGWGNCGAAPDTYVTLSPEFPNAVVNGLGTGTLNSDICSDQLGINNGTSGDPVCGTGETHNFYHWTSPSTTTQERSIYVTYQLPSNFDNFVAGSTSLMARTDNTKSQVSYQIYHNDVEDGLTACAAAATASQGATAWTKTTLSGSADPSTCGFAAGDSIVVKVTLGARDDANAYLSNINFTYSSN